MIAPKALILAAGQGTRLRPHTDHKPKCMVELLGKPMLHRQLEVLESAGIKDLVLIGGYKADKLNAPQTKIVLNPRFAETNMVSTLFCAESEMTDGEDLIISYGDIVYEPKVLQSLLATDAPIVIAVDNNWLDLWQSRMEDPLSDAETLKLDANGNITELGKKPTSLAEIQGQYMGLIKIRGDFIKTFKSFYHQLDKTQIYDGKDFDNMYMTSFLQLMIDAGHQAKAAFTENGWVEVDSVEDLAHYEKMHEQGRLLALVKLQQS